MRAFDKHVMVRNNTTKTMPRPVSVLCPSSLTMPWGMNAVMSRAKPSAVPWWQVPAYNVFERLVAHFLLAGSRSPRSDARQMALELREPGVRDCFTHWIVEDEFDGVVMAVLRLGPSALQQPNRVWPHDDGMDGAAVRSMVRLLLTGLVLAAWNDETGRLRSLVAAAGMEVLPDPRTVARGLARGRPRNPELDGMVRQMLRERVFGDGLSRANAIRKATVVMDLGWKHRSLRRRVKRAAQVSVPVPEHWASTLLASRSTALYDSPLRALAVAKRAAAV